MQLKNNNVFLLKIPFASSAIFKTNYSKIINNKKILGIAYYVLQWKNNDFYVVRSIPRFILKNKYFYTEYRPNDLPMTKTTFWKNNSEIRKKIFGEKIDKDITKKQITLEQLSKLNDWCLTQNTILQGEKLVTGSNSAGSEYSYNKAPFKYYDDNSKYNKLIFVNPIKYSQNTSKAISNDFIYKNWNEIESIPQINLDFLIKNSLEYKKRFVLYNPDYFENIEQIDFTKEYSRNINDYDNYYYEKIKDKASEYLFEKDNKNKNKIISSLRRIHSLWLRLEYQNNSKEKYIYEDNANEISYHASHIIPVEYLKTKTSINGIMSIGDKNNGILAASIYNAYLDSFNFSFNLDGDPIIKNNFKVIPTPHLNKKYLNQKRKEYIDKRNNIWNFEY